MACNDLFNKPLPGYLKNGWDYYYYSQWIDKYMQFSMAISIAIAMSLSPLKIRKI